MNINYGDKGYIVKYIQAFLNENYDSSIAITGQYDTNTHNSLIKYLNLPNITTNKNIIIESLKSNFSFIDKYFVVNNNTYGIVFKFNIDNITIFDYIMLTSKYEDTPHVNIKFFVSFSKGKYDKYITNSRLKDIIAEFRVHMIDYTSWYNTLSLEDKIILNEFFQNLVKDIIGNEMYNNQNNVNKLLYSFGWYTLEYTNYKSNNVTDLIISIVPYNRKNLFPNNDAIYMINQFNNYILDNTCIRDGLSFDDLVQDCNDKCRYKLCLIPCDSKKKFTISHGYSSGVNLYIASCNTNYKDIKKSNTIVNNTVSVFLEPGEYYIYETTDTIKTLVIQVPQISDKSMNINTKLLLGDLDSNELINADDVALFDSYWTYMLLLNKYSSRSNLIDYLNNSEKIDISVSYSKSNILSKEALLNISKYNNIHILKVKLSEFKINNISYNYIIEYYFDENTNKDYIKLVSCNDNNIVNKDKICINDRLKARAKVIWDEDDLIIYPKSRQAIVDSIEKRQPIISSNGGNKISYNYEIKSNDNYNKLLVIDVTNLSTQEDINNLNIPYNEFIDNQWAVHEKLLNYILGMTINEYSDEDDIDYAQKLVKEVLCNNLDISTCNYNNIKKIVKSYQEDRHISFSSGYIDVETDSYLRKASNNYGY